MHFLNSVLGGAPHIQQATILNPLLGKESDDLANLSKEELGARIEALERQLETRRETS